MNEPSCAEPIAQLLSVWVRSTQLGLPLKSAIASRLDHMRLEELVLGLLNLNENEAAQVESLTGSEALFELCPEQFYAMLQQAIQQFRLFKLFARTRDGQYHRSICPAAYNEVTGEHHPQEMARWRANFRAMSPEQQMMAATIIWLYRSGPDSIWLRRVPCTWKASEGLHYMHDSGSLAVWLKLVARYPGW